MPELNTHPMSFIYQLLALLLVLCMSIIPTGVGALELVSYDPEPGRIDVPFDRHSISFSFDHPVLVNSGFVHLYVQESETRWLASLSVAVDGDQVRYTPPTLLNALFYHDSFPPSFTHSV